VVDVINEDKLSEEIKQFQYSDLALAAQRQDTHHFLELLRANGTKPLEDPAFSFLSYLPREELTKEVLRDVIDLAGTAYMQNLKEGLGHDGGFAKLLDHAGKCLSKILAEEQQQEPAALLSIRWPAAEKLLI